MWQQCDERGNWEDIDITEDTVSFSNLTENMKLRCVVNDDYGNRKNVYIDIYVTDAVMTDCS